MLKPRPSRSSARSLVLLGADLLGHARGGVPDGTPMPALRSPGKPVPSLAPRPEDPPWPEDGTPMPA